MFGNILEKFKQKKYSLKETYLEHKENQKNREFISKKDFLQTIYNMDYFIQSNDDLIHFKGNLLDRSKILDTIKENTFNSILIGVAGSGKTYFLQDKYKQKKSKVIILGGHPIDFEGFQNISDVNDEFLLEILKNKEEPQRIKIDFEFLTNPKPLYDFLLYMSKNGYHIVLEEIPRFSKQVHTELDLHNSKNVLISNLIKLENFSLIVQTFNDLHYWFGSDINKLNHFKNIIIFHNNDFLNNKIFFMGKEVKSNIKLTYQNNLYKTFNKRNLLFLENKNYKNYKSL